MATEKDPENIDSLIQEAGLRIRDCNIGFVLLKGTPTEEDASIGGSGTLVSVEKVTGIVTAGHVLRHLPTSGDVGFARCTDSGEIQKHTIDINLTERLTVWDGIESPSGPDIGFLRLPDQAVGTFMARHTILNLEKRRDRLLASDFAKGPHFDGVFGFLAEWTVDNTEASERRKGFKALYGVGLAGEERTSGEYDFCDLDISYGPEAETPTSFGGMSGGGLWRAHLTRDGDKVTLRDVSFWGVAFYERPESEGKRIIVCHGRRSVYDVLLAQVADRWGG